jgi:hypothetical protein
MNIISTLVNIVSVANASREIYIIIILNSLYFDDDDSDYYYYYHHYLLFHSIGEIINLCALILSSGITSLLLARTQPKRLI